MMGGETGEKNERRNRKNVAKRADRPMSSPKISRRRVCAKFDFFPLLPHDRLQIRSPSVP